MVRDWSAVTSFTWDTTAATAGTYTFEIHARQTGSALAYESYVDVSYVLSATTLGAPCSSTAFTPNPTSPRPTGTTVTWTATATGCTSAEFQIWLLPPAGGWRIARDWSTTPTFDWITTGATPGSFTFELHARQVGSTAAYEAYSDVSYVLSP
jgi:cell wall-associated protease